jgi:SNF2 family DNA or RNA helicase
LIQAELYLLGRPLIIVERDAFASPGAWSRLQEALSRGIVGGGENRLEVRPDVFLAELESIRDVRRLYAEKITFGPQILAQFQSLARDRVARERVASSVGEAIPDIGPRLNSAGFVRALKPFQTNNLQVLARLPHGADFSVPGAGKTTVALANFVLHRQSGDVARLLVIAPIAAFAAWKEDSRACIHPPPVINVHGGPGSVVPENTEILLTTYGRVAADYDRIRRYVADTPTHVILDEAHRVKKGASGVHGRAVLDLAYAARRRDVLTGTPSPQGAYDLVALMRFLYPGQDRQILPGAAYNERNGRDADVLRETSAAIRRYFVRTTKSQLDLPPTRFVVDRREMAPVQKAIYDSLIGRYRAAFQINQQDRRRFDRIGRVAMYLLEAATNPMLLVAGSDSDDEPAFRHPPLDIRGDERLLELLERYSLYETPWKYGVVTALVRQAQETGEKVLVWSNFVRNIHLLARHLAAFNPAIVHGGIPSVDAATSSVVTTREAELDRFKNDPNCTVLLANPAACGEGVSLHHWCHHAVYLERTFNAGHFLQSQDRIHRIGLAPDVVTQYTLLLSRRSIDESVDGRLRSKVDALSVLMDDPGLVRVALPEADEEGADDPPAAADDEQEIVAHITRYDGSNP